MSRAILLGAAVLMCAALGHAVASDDASSDPKPQFSGDKLVRPEGYREWIYLSSGLGMNYNPAPGMAELFTNVFVPRWAYRQFVATGKWPDKTWFVLEERDQQTRGSINKTGRFQTGLMGLAVEVKDEKRFPDQWAYFGFGGDDKTATANPKEACWECHENNAAVEHSFVQFYPTLKPIAQKFGTYRQRGEAAAPASH
jgi:Cytochrome P460